MIKCFEIFTPIVRGNLDAIEELARRFVEGQAKQNVIYTEVRYSPHLLAEGGSFSGTEKVDPRPVIAAVTRGLRAGCEACGVTVNQILCCITWRPDWAEEVVDLASELKDSPGICKVVGVDIAAGEVRDIGDES